MRWTLRPLAFALLIATAAAASGAGAGGTLVSGPMLGHRAHREVLLWLETRGARQVEVVCERIDRPDPAGARRFAFPAPAPTPAGVQPLTASLALLEMGARYRYRILVDGVDRSPPVPLEFATTDQWEWRRPPPDFRFALGSCAYLNDTPYDRPGAPYGKTLETFRLIAESGADFMLWAGDNTYLREADFSSAAGIWYRFSHDRATPELARLLAGMHHYATWDDHDYGSNDSNRSFELKHVTLDAFRRYWANPGFGEADNPGVYGKFFWGDAAFILLDNRYHRDDTLLDASRHPGKTQYGARQREWLKQSLLQAQQLRLYPFKFIVTGGQVLTDHTGTSETFAAYPQERAELLDFIRDHAITGVIFLSGDVHFTEMLRLRLGDRWVYEVTSSPLSSGVHSRAAIERADEPRRVAGTLVVEQNFVQIDVAGPADDRAVTVRCIDRTGQTRWQQRIPAADLR